MSATEDLQKSAKAESGTGNPGVRNQKSHWVAKKPEEVRALGKKVCHKCGGQYPLCGCKKDRARVHKDAAVLSQAVCEEEQRLAALRDAERMREAEERAKAAEAAEVARLRCLHEGYSRLAGTKFTWYTGARKTLVGSVLNGIFSWGIIKLRETVEKWDVKVGDLHSPLGWLPLPTFNDTLNVFLDSANDSAVSEGVRCDFTAEFDLNPQPEDDNPDHHDSRAEGQTLKAIKYQPVLWKVTVTATNIFRKSIFDMIVSWELFSHLTNCQVWHYGMDPKTIEQRMLMAARSFHMINYNRYLLETVQQDTIRVAVGWATGQSQQKNVMSFRAPLDSTLPAMATEPARLNYPH